MMVIVMMVIVMMVIVMMVIVMMVIAEVVIFGVIVLEIILCVGVRSADFGLAKMYGVPLRPMTPKVVTLW